MGIKLQKGEFYSVALEKARVALNAKNDSELAGKLGVSRFCISHARKRGSAPLQSLVETCCEHSISLDWIFGINQNKNQMGRE